MSKNQGRVVVVMFLSGPYLGTLREETNKRKGEEEVFGLFGKDREMGKGGSQGRG